MAGEVERCALEMSVGRGEDIRRGRSSPSHVAEDLVHNEIEGGGQRHLMVVVTEVVVRVRVEGGGWRVEGGGWRVEGLAVAEGPRWAGEEGAAGSHAGSVTSLESPLYSSSTRGPGCCAWWTPSALIRTTGRVRRSDATTARCRCCSPGGRGVAAPSASASGLAAPTLKWEGRRSSESRRISWR